MSLFGITVHTGVIVLEYINRVRGYTIVEAAVEDALLRLRPVATPGMLPAATSRGIGSDSQRPFAIVFVGGLLAAEFGI